MLKLKKEFRETLLAHAQNSRPQEACGILAGPAPNGARAGRQTDENDEVQKIYQMSNISDTPRLCYFMDPKEQFKVQKEIREQGLAMLAIYHSHPESGAYPSAKDIEMAFYPEVYYIIISLRDLNLKAYKINGQKIQEEKIKYV